MKLLDFLQQHLKDLGPIIGSIDHKDLTQGTVYQNKFHEYELGSDGDGKIEADLYFNKTESGHPMFTVKTNRGSLICNVSLGGVNTSMQDQSHIPTQRLLEGYDIDNTQQQELQQAIAAKVAQIKEGKAVSAGPRAQPVRAKKGVNWPEEEQISETRTMPSEEEEVHVGDVPAPAIRSSPTKSALKPSKKLMADEEFQAAMQKTNDDRDDQGNMIFGSEVKIAERGGEGELTGAHGTIQSHREKIKMNAGSDYKDNEDARAEALKIALAEAASIKAASAPATVSGGAPTAEEGRQLMQQAIARSTGTPATVSGASPRPRQASSQDPTAPTRLSREEEKLALFKSYFEALKSQGFTRIGVDFDRTVTSEHLHADHGSNHRSVEFLGSHAEQWFSKDAVNTFLARADTLGLKGDTSKVATGSEIANLQTFAQERIRAIKQNIKDKELLPNGGEDFKLLLQAAQDAGLKVHINSNGSARIIEYILQSYDIKSDQVTHVAALNYNCEPIILDRKKSKAKATGVEYMNGHKQAANEMIMGSEEAEHGSGRCLLFDDSNEPSIETITGDGSNLGYYLKQGDSPRQLQFHNSKSIGSPEFYQQLTREAQQAEAKSGLARDTGGGDVSPPSLGPTTKVVSLTQESLEAHNRGVGVALSPREVSSSFARSAASSSIASSAPSDNDLLEAAVAGSSVTSSRSPSTRSRPPSSSPSTKEAKSFKAQQQLTAEVQKYLDHKIDSSDPVFQILEENLKTQNTEPNPTQAYRGCGIKASFDKENRFMIDEVFAAAINRFNIQEEGVQQGCISNSLLISDPKKEITAILVGSEFKSPIQIINDEIQKNPTDEQAGIDDGLAIIADAFHGKQDTKFIVKSEGGAEVELSCAGDNKDVFVTRDCQSAKLETVGKTGDKYNPSTHGTQAIDPKDAVLGMLQDRQLRAAR